MKMKIERLITIISIGFIFTVFLALPITSGAKITLRLASIWSSNSPEVMADKKFADLVYQKTGGEIKINIYPDSQLGGLLEIYAGLKMGTIDMACENVGTYGWVKEAQILQIEGVHYLFKNYDHMKRVFQSNLFQEIFKDLEPKTGVVVMAVNGYCPPRQLTTTNKPVWNVNDLKGMKIRIPEAPITQTAFRTWGASTVVVPFADLYMALKTGVAEGQDNGIITIRKKSLYEVQHYLMLMDYVPEIKAWMVSKKKWDSFSGETKKILTECAEEAGNYYTSLIQKEEAEDLEFLTTKMRVIVPDRDSFRKALNGVFEKKFEGKIWPKGLIAQIKAME